MSTRYLSSGFCSLMALTLAGLVGGPGGVLAAEAEKVKPLEKFDKVDEKTLKLYDAQHKIVNTKDKEHPRVLELKMDFAKPGSWSGFSKTFPEGTLNPNRYEAFRFAVKSDVGTSFTVFVNGGYKRKDGKYSGFSGGEIQGTSEWKVITVPLKDLKRQSLKVFKDGKQMMTPGGGEPMDEEDYGGITMIGLRTSVERRGTSVIGHLMFDSLELLEKKK
jgi:hypothetical protein